MATIAVAAMVVMSEGGGVCGFNDGGSGDSAGGKQKEKQMNLA